MSLTRRGRVMVGVVTVLLLAAVGVGAVLALGGTDLDLPGIGDSNGPGAVQTTPPPPPECPLSGVDPEADVPVRPALAIKVENLPSARPQTGLSWADIVYEQPVEGGITRFLAIYQCQDAGRIEPVRSARFVDPDILVQFGAPLFAYAGAIPPVVSRIEETTSITDLNYLRQPAAYLRDPDRFAPHDLYTGTRELYEAAGSPRGLPEPVFTYRGKDRNQGTKVSGVRIEFSIYSDVHWRWAQSDKRWLRFHGTDPSSLSDGTQISTSNVVVQVVKTEPSPYVDSNGVPQMYVTMTGSGKAYVFSNGRMIAGTWKRSSLADVTRFYDSQGEEIALSPGTTWVEIVPLEIFVFTE